MTKYAFKRLLQAIPTILGVTVLAYFIMASAPGSPASQLFFDPNLSQRQREAMADALGVNDPMHVQYARWLIGDRPYEILGVTIWGGRELPVFDRRGMETGTQLGDRGGILRGDFGKSVISKRDTTEIIQGHLAATFELGGISLLVGLLIGIPVGVLAAVQQGSIFDQFTRVASVLVSAIPVFWLGLILLLIFGAWLGWLPMGNRFPISVQGEYTIFDRVRHLILPVFTLSSFTIATYSRFMRAAVLDVLSQDYIRTAHSKGLSSLEVWFNHATQNALLPIATLLGASFSTIVSGAVLTETIYSWPGMGRLVVDSIQQQDYPIIMGITLLFSVFTVIGYLVSDVLYAMLDPRVRLD
jgi:peptide/nickel transport system permease protein